MLAERKRILVLCKTYPSPSAKHVETSCVAGMEDAGRLIRLYPVPFRLIADEQQFRKWQWISARVRKATEDHRVESYRISVDTIDIHGEPLSTKDAGAERRNAIEPLTVFEDFDALADDFDVTLYGSDRLANFKRVMHEHGAGEPIEYLKSLLGSVGTRAMSEQGLPVDSEILAIFEAVKTIVEEP